MAGVKDTQLVRDDPAINRLGRAFRMPAHVHDCEPKQLEARLLGRLTGISEEERLLDPLSCTTAEKPTDVLTSRNAGSLVAPGPIFEMLRGHSDSLIDALSLADCRRALSWLDGEMLRLRDLCETKIAVSESQEGIDAALRTFLNAAYQRSRVHFIRNGLVPTLPRTYVGQGLAERAESRARLGSVPQIKRSGEFNQKLLIARSRYV